MNKIKKSFLNKSINIKNRSYHLENCYYIIAGKTCFLTKKMVDSCVRIIRFYIKRATAKKNKKFINCIQFNIPLTKKSKKSRMGSGKGKVRKIISKVHMNSLMFIFRNVKYFIMFKVFKYLKENLPIKIYLKNNITK